MKDSFDDILKKKWEEFRFPVDNDHRNDMIRLLDQHHRRRTGLFWWFGGIGGGIVIMAAIILFVNRDPSGEQTPVTPSDHVEKEIIAQNTEKPEQPSSSMDNKAEGDAVIENEKESGNVNTNTTGSNVSADSPGKSSDVKAGEADKKITSKKLNTGKFESKREVATTAQTDKENNQPVEVNENSNTPEVSNPIITGIPSSISNESIAGAASETTKGRSHFGITESLDPLSIDELLYERESIKKLEPVVIKHHPVYLFAETGYGFVPSSQPNYTSGWTWRAGGGLDYGLNTRQHISLSVGYLLQKDGFDFEKSSTVQQADFGARSNFHSLSPDKLHFVYARLGVHQRIHRHVLSLFAGTQYLYGAQGTIAIQSQDQLSGTYTDTQYGWLNVNGMKKWHWSGEAQYGYQLLPKVSLHAGLKYHFTSLEATDDSLEDDGYYWDGKISSVSPFITLNYHLYGKK